MRTLRRCLGLNRNLNRCNRRGHWRGFCPEHRKQPLVWLFVLIFTVLAGTASILSYLRTWSPLITSRRDITASAKSSPEIKPNVKNGQSNELGEATVAANSPSFSSITMQEFFSTMFNWSLTSLQRDEILKQHLGRTVIWQGRISNVSDATMDNSIEVIMVEGNVDTIHLAFLTFSPNYRASLLSLKSGQELEITGILQRFDGQAHLDNCRTLRVLPTKREAAETSRSPALSKSDF